LPQWSRSAKLQLQLARWGWYQSLCSGRILQLTLFVPLSRPSETLVGLSDYGGSWTSSPWRRPDAE
jgi:hypothetical protein